MAGELDPKAAEELAKSMQAIKASTIDTTRAFEDQLRIITQMRDAMSQMAGNLDGISQQGQTGLLSPDGWEQVSKNIKSTTENTSKAAGAMEKLGKIMKSPVTGAAIAMAGAFTGLVQGFKNLFALGKGIGGVLGSLADTAFSVGKAIVSIPFKMLDGLIGMASKGGDNSYAVALEEVRDQFGSLKSESSRAVLDIAHSMDKMNQTGVSAYSIFGNMAERIKAVNELAKGMGNTFQVFQKEIEQNGVAIMMYQRGLGLTDEQMQSVASTAMRMGKGVADVQNEMTKQAVGMSKAFGLNAKVLSKDMGKAMQDLAHFGHLSTKEMAVSAAFAQKLGVAVDKLTGIMDATATFDQAAEGMSKLNETFGTNIDATKMMMAQTPQEKIEMLRKEFAKTGKSLESMNMQERMLIKQSSGMSDEMLNAALSSKNAGVSLDKLNKQGDKNEKQTMSQAEAMHELADSIKRIPQAGAGGGGFLDHILSGFSRGIQSSGEFMKLMRHIQQSLREATMFGVRLGKMFVDLFPGVKDVLGGLGDIFNPNRFRKMFGEVMKTFDVFKAGGTGKMEDFMARIKDVFLNFFNPQEGPGQKVLGGFKKFGESVAIVFGKMSEWVMLKLADIVTDITAWLKAPKIPNISGGISDGVKKPFTDALAALTDKLWPALQDFGSVLWSKLTDAILHSKVGKMAMGAALATVFIPVLTGLVGGLATAGLFKKTGAAIVGASGAAGGMGGIMGGIEKATTAVGNISNSAAPEATAGKEMLTAATPERATMDKLNEASGANTDWDKAKKFLLGMAGLYAVLGGTFAAVLKIVKGVPVGDLVAATLVTAALSAFLIPMSAAAEALSKVGSVDWKQVGTTLTSIAGMMTIGLVAFGTAVFAVKKLNITPQHVMTAGLVMLGVGETMAIALGVIKLAQMVGDPASASAGLTAMGIVLVAMGGVAVATTILTALAGVDKMNAAVGILNAISKVFLVAAGVTVIAGVLGAAITGTFGLGAVAIAAGLGAIGATIAAMGATAVGIILALDKVPANSGIEVKTKAFADVMGAISGLAGQVANILKGIDFGFLEGEASQAKRMGLVNDMIKTLLDGQDGKGGIRGIIETVVKGVQEIKPENIPVMGALGNILTAAGSMISVMMGKLNDVQSDSTRWFSLASKADDQVKTMESSRGFIESSLKGLSSFIAGISTSLKGVENPEAFAKVAGSIGPILTAAGSMVAAITPNMEKFQKETSGSLSFSKNFKNTGVDTDGIAAMTTGVASIMTSMSSSLPVLVNSLMGGIAQTISKLDEKQLKALPVVGDIIKAVAAIIEAVTKSTVGSNQSASNVSSAAAAVSSMTASVPTISQIMFELSVEMPRLVKNLVGVIDTMPKGISEKAKNLADVFDSLNKVISVVGGIDKVVTQVPGQGTANSVLMSLNSIDTILWGMLSNWTNNNAPTLKWIFGHLDEIVNIKGADAALSNSKKLFDIFSGLEKLIGAISRPLAAVQDPNVLLKNLSALQGTLWGMLKNWTSGNTPTLEWIYGHLQTIVNIKGTDATLGNTKKLTDIISGLGKLTDAVAPITNLKNLDPTKTSENLGKIETTLNAENMQARLASIVSSMKVLSDEKHSLSKDSADKVIASLNLLSDKSKNINATMSGLPNLMDGFAKFGTSFNGIKDVKLDSKGVLQAVAEMIDQTRQLDAALDTLPKLTIPAKLGTIAKGMGLGGKFAYTVQSKEVVINVEFNVTMDVGNVEKILVSRTNSIIRDRINYAIKHTGSDPKKDNAYIRPAASANNTPVASDVGN